MNTYWYIMRVFPGKEKQTSDEFNERITHGVLKKVLRFVCPIEKELITVRKKKVLRDKVIYSGYIYFESGDKLTEDDLKYLSSFENIMMMNGTKTPQLLSQRDVDRIIKDDDLTERVKYQTEGLKIGNKVQIIDGAFINFYGTIKEISGEKITLDVSVFGRPTNVIVNNNQIKK